jgi:hypothetical protein
MLARVVSSWTQREPDGALEWLLSKGTAVDASVLGNMARTMASRDAVAAAAYVDRLPPALRTTWMTQVAGPYARYDAVGALRWLNQYQGQEGYDVALRQMATQAAQSDPRAAAGMLERASPDVQFGAAQTVASSWARSEPEAAARWAVALSDPRARSSAITAAASTWASSDAAAAERWVLSLAPGTARDDALTAVLPRRAAAGEDLDSRLLASFSSAEARQTALARIIPVLGRNNPAEAQRLLDGYVTDPSQRAQLEQQMARTASDNLTPTTVIDSGGNVIFLQR